MTSVVFVTFVLALYVIRMNRAELDVGFTIRVVVVAVVITNVAVVNVVGVPESAVDRGDHEVLSGDPSTW